MIELSNKIRCTYSYKLIFCYVFQHTERKYDRQNGHLFIYNGSSFLDDMKQTGTNTLCQNFGIC